MDLHEFCRDEFRLAKVEAGKEIAALFTRKNIGVTRSGKQFAVEFVKGPDGTRLVEWVKADCKAEAKAKVIHLLVARKARAVDEATLSVCRKCGKSRESKASHGLCFECWCEWVGIDAEGHRLEK